MKKINILVVSTAIVISLSACTQRAETRNQTRVDMHNTGTSNVTTPNAGKVQGYDVDYQQYNTNRGTTTGQSATYKQTADSFYKEGTYTAYGDATPLGNQSSTVTITNGRISNVRLDYVDKQGRIINYPENMSGDYPAQGVTQNVTGDFNSRRILSNYIVQLQTYNVNVSGANTADIDNWKLATKRALEQAQR